MVSTSPGFDGSEPTISKHNCVPKQADVTKSMESIPAPLTPDKTGEVLLQLSTLN